VEWADQMTPFEAELSETNLFVIDDAESDRVIGDSLGGPQLVVNSAAPDADLLKMIRTTVDFAREHPNPLILIDYRLDSNSSISYRGGTLAAAMKDSSLSCPVVLYTSDAIMRESLSQRPRSRAVFDYHILKDDLVTDVDQVRRELSALATGYADLVAIYASSSPAFGAHVLQMALAPPSGVTSFLDWAPSVQAVKSPSGASTFLLDEVFNADGPLLTTDEAAAALGITKASFATSDRWDRFSYKGVYAGMQGRWWLDGLERPLDSDFTHDDSVMPLEKAACNWCQGSVARACAHCNAPCGDEHSLPAFENVPVWSRGHVFCYLCIAQGAVSVESIDPSARDVADMIVSGDIEPAR